MQCREILGLNLLTVKRDVCCASLGNILSRKWYYFFTYATWHYQLHWVHPHYDLVHLLHQPMHLPGSLRPCRKSLIHQTKVDQHEMDFEWSRHHQPLRRGDWLWHWLMLQSTGNTWRVSAQKNSRISHHPFLSWQRGGQRPRFQKQRNITEKCWKSMLKMMFDGCPNFFRRNCWVPGRELLNS